jgi:hypothetical protein
MNKLYPVLLVVILFGSFADQALAQNDTTQKAVTWEFATQ